MNPLSTFLNYIHYYLTSQTPHGIHSPFVYQLLTQVIQNKTNYSGFTPIELLRTRLLADNRIIAITDLGAGSKKSTLPERKVKQIVKHASKSPKYAQLLFRLVQYFKPATILELGTSLGLSTLYLAAGNTKAQVITVEGCPETAALAAANFHTLHANNISLISGNFDSILPSLLNDQKQLDFVFIDGNHRKQPTLNYFETCLAKCHNNSVVIIDDIYWSLEMQEVWQHIKKHPQVTVTLDLFFMGIVFFRREQAKQHFVIRF